MSNPNPVSYMKIHQSEFNEMDFSSSWNSLSHVLKQFSLSSRDDLTIEKTPIKNEKLND